MEERWLICWMNHPGLPPEQVVHTLQQTDDPIPNFVPKMFRLLLAFF